MKSCRDVRAWIFAATSRTTGATASTAESRVSVANDIARERSSSGTKARHALGFLREHGAIRRSGANAGA